MAKQNRGKGLWGKPGRGKGTCPCAHAPAPSCSGRPRTKAATTSGLQALQKSLEKAGPCNFYIPRERLLRWGLVFSRRSHSFSDNGCPQ